MKYFNFFLNTGARSCHVRDLWAEKFALDIPCNVKLIVKFHCACILKYFYLRKRKVNNWVKINTQIKKIKIIGKWSENYWIQSQMHHMRVISRTM